MITLLIISEIATFTIPKILSSSQDQMFNTRSRETMATIAAAYQVYAQNTTPTATTKSLDLLPYLNYINYDTSGTLIDNFQGSGSRTCNAAEPCIQLHNGATLLFWNSASNFGGTTSNNVIWFLIDPDSVYSGSTTGYGKGVWIALYFNGRITTGAQIASGTVDSSGARTPLPDPTWLH
jgi:type II secretory pathway pseudopilin PulG